MVNAPKYKSLRGMPDILPEDAALMRWIWANAEDVFRVFGFNPIHTPILEETEVFTKSIGLGTDIVEKEMYSFIDRGGKSISLRPEGTASVIRAYIEHLCYKTYGLVKLYYGGPMFRGERPQKGRYRQFHQIGVEMIGASSPYIDAELIFSLNEFMNRIKLEGFTILINSLGCSLDRAGYSKVLSEYLHLKDAGLCEDCQRRRMTNVLRVLDCKRDQCGVVIKEAPKMVEYLCDNCLKYYGMLKDILSDSGVPFSEKKNLVRGLDYYTGIIFEAVHPLLGSQDALAAGGRYDNLVKKMGGPDVGATGYAVGIERLFLVIGRENTPLETAKVSVIAVSDGDRLEAFRVCNRLRKKGISCEMDHSTHSFKGEMRKAAKDGRKFVIIIGEEETKTGSLVFKDMETGQQKVLKFEEIAACLA